MVSVLIIDDSKFSRLIVAKILEKHGFMVMEAVNGDEGMKKVIELSPDCIILDLLMPGMSGHKFMKSIRQKKILTPIVVLSADIQDSTKEKVMENGAIAMLSKPPKEREVLEAVESALNKSKGDN